MVSFFSGLGQKTLGTTEFYTFDHLGSIREVTNGSGTVQGAFDFDPYGNMSVLAGSLKPDFGFTGIYQHSRTNLALTWFRQYNPGFGRWLSRDPLEENGGLNFYEYAANSPSLLLDPLGLITDEALNIKVEPKLSPGGGSLPSTNGAGAALGGAAAAGAGLGAGTTGTATASSAPLWAGVIAIGSGLFVIGGRIIGSYKDLQKANIKDAHHVYQDKAMPGIPQEDGICVQLQGPSHIYSGSEHGNATAAQLYSLTIGGGPNTEAAIAYKSLVNAGIAPMTALAIIKFATDMHMIDASTPTRNPGNRYPY